MQPAAMEFSLCSRLALRLGSHEGIPPSQDEFCTYMLLEYQEKDVMAGEKLPPFPYPLRVLHRWGGCIPPLTHTPSHSHTLTLTHPHTHTPSHTHTHSLSLTPSLTHTHSHSSHRETISRITFLPNLNRRSHDCSGKSHEAGGQDWRDVDGRILSVCKDGTLCFWKSNLTLQKVVTVSLCLK